MITQPETKFASPLTEAEDLGADDYLLLIAGLNELAAQAREVMNYEREAACDDLRDRIHGANEIRLIPIVTPDPRHELWLTERLGQSLKLYDAHCSCGQWTLVDVRESYAQRVHAIHLEVEASAEVTS